jgi:hypothetical protein
MDLYVKKYEYVRSTNNRFKSFLLYAIHKSIRFAIFNQFYVHPKANLSLFLAHLLGCGQFPKNNQCQISGPNNPQAPTLNDLIFYYLFIYIYNFALEQAMKAQRGVEVYLYFFFNLRVRWRWVVNATLRPLYLRETKPVPIVYEAVWVPGPVWTGAEISPPPDRPARRTESLFRLSYRGTHTHARTHTHTTLSC